MKDSQIINISDKKNKAGRPSLYEPDVHPKQAFVACSKMGAKKEDLAELFSVHRDTITEWMSKHQEFSAAVKIGRDEWDTNKAEVAMQKIVTGYDYIEATEVKDKDGNITKEVVTTKHVPPNITAIMFWLQNRAGRRWKNVRKIEAKLTTDGEMRHIYSGGADMKIKLENLDKKELENLRELVYRASPVKSITND